jgi:hypothetical protein
VDTDVAVQVKVSNPKVSPVILSIQGNGGGNGKVTINGQAELKVTSSTSIKLRGVDQTDPKKGGNLRLVADMDGTRVASSNGFSVSAIPQNWSNGFLRIIPHDEGPYLGIEVQDMWESDSGPKNIADLDQVRISESIELTTKTGAFSDVTEENMKTSNYFPGNKLTLDSHLISKYRNKIYWDVGGLCVYRFWLT